MALGTVETRVGAFGAVLSPHGVCRLTLPGEPPGLGAAWVERRWPGARLQGARGGALERLAAELDAYLTGRLRQFSVPLDLYGTPFQIEVWSALRAIAYGDLRTYRQMAAAVGRPRGLRAVGAAMGANPVPILVPCHRVIGSNGGLVGYSGGLPLKRFLLELEARSTAC